MPCLLTGMAASGSMVSTKWPLHPVLCLDPPLILDRNSYSFRVLRQSPLLRHPAQVRYGCRQKLSPSTPSHSMSAEAKLLPIIRSMYPGTPHQCVAACQLRPPLQSSLSCHLVVLAVAGRPFVEAFPVAVRAAEEWPLSVFGRYIPLRIAPKSRATRDLPHVVRVSNR